MLKSLNDYIPPTLLADFYKMDHRRQYPKETELIYSTWTARTSRIPNINHTIPFGYQAFLWKYLVNYFEENFFMRRVTDVVREYKRVIKYTLGIDNPDTEHIIKLHQLGYLPLEINAVPEGMHIPIRVPSLTIHNTLPEFFWVTNYFETLMSCEIWSPTTSATMGTAYREILDSWAEETSDMPTFVDFQAHDFSMRGMSSLETASASGAGHLLSFVGTDVIPSILYLEKFYNANIEKELVGTSIPATEHSVMEAGGLDEEKTFYRLLTEIYPSGMFSVVSDTWDLWKILTEVLPELKDVIINRDGKMVIRPDSGDPADIICGVFPYFQDSNKEMDPDQLGVINILWNIFGGTINAKGFKQLDSHIGAIYGDAISLVRADNICSRLAAKGFASTNIVFGVGSYTYQYATRDTFGHALKTTYGVFGGVGVDLFKDPITDKAAFKKSQVGRVFVGVGIDGIRFWDGDEALEIYSKIESGKLRPVTYWGKDIETGRDVPSSNNTIIQLLRPVYRNGEVLVNDDLSIIRWRVRQKYDKTVR